MSRSLPSAVVEVGRALTTNAGGYLRGVVRVPGVTCLVCATPTDHGYHTCYPCGQHARSGLPVADRVASLVYALKPTSAGGRDQMYTAMFGYKAPVPQSAHTDVVRSLLVLGILGHVDCDFKLARMPNFRWATVPGTRHRGEHPLHGLVAPLFADPRLEVGLGLRAGAVNDRRLHPENVELVGELQPRTHVALYDDSWVTGCSAQSVAIALKQAGAQSVSILTVARVLGPDYSANSAFLKSAYATRGFDYAICPWTGEACP